MPNGALVLKRLGFDFQRALVGRHQRLETVNGVTLAPLTHIDLSNVEKEYGGHMQSVLRADLHSELLRLTKEGPNPASLHLGSAVKRVDSSTGQIELESGEVHRADLIIAADGAHSVCRSEVLGYDQPPKESGNNAFRFLIPTEKIPDLEEIKSLIPGRVPGATIFADVYDKLKTRHLAWYECHGYVPSKKFLSSMLGPPLTNTKGEAPELCWHLSRCPACRRCRPQRNAFGAV